MNRPWGFLVRALAIAAALTTLLASCGEKNKSVTGPGGGATESDRDGDGVADSRDNCPDLAGESRYNGCPWYKVDLCSGNAPYVRTGQKWGTTTPAFSYDGSLPSAWRINVDYAASQWNAAGARMEIRKSSTVVSAGYVKDGKSVVSYGALAGQKLGETMVWYSASTGIISEADIRLNSNQPLTVGGSGSSYDVYSVLTHEFGHFLGLTHVDDRTHTMYGSTPKDCTIYRTLCAGDVTGIRAIYP